METKRIVLPQKGAGASLFRASWHREVAATFTETIAQSDGGITHSSTGGHTMELLSTGNILDFAIDHEQQAVAYYADMAAKMQSEALRSVFEALSGEEQTHVEVLTEMRAHGTPFKNSCVQVLDATADCPPGTELAVESALRLAAMREKAAFKLYFGLAQEALDPVTRGILLDLARQEAGHKLQLELALDTQVNRLSELDNL
jgi:rubrerythrin